MYNWSLVLFICKWKTIVGMLTNILYNSYLNMALKIYLCDFVRCVCWDEIYCNIAVQLLSNYRCSYNEKQSSNDSHVVRYTAGVHRTHPKAGPSNETFVRGDTSAWYKSSSTASSAAQLERGASRCRLSRARWSVSADFFPFISFNWMQNNSPEYRGKITIDWREREVRHTSVRRSQQKARETMCVCCTIHYSP